MSEENKRKLNEQLIRCVLDDKLSTDKKLRKMDYIIKMGGDIDYNDENGFSVLILAKMAGNEEVVQFLMEKGVKDISIDNKKVEQFFKRASVEEINKFLNVLPDGYEFDCDVDLNRKNLTELPDFSRFTVNGNFDCSVNNLSSLKGAPIVVWGDFDYRCNPKTEIREDGPSIVGGEFLSATYNKHYFYRANDGNEYNLFRLPDIDITIKKSIDLSNLGLTKLPDLSRVKLLGAFICSYNNLISLEGAPKEVKGNFNCSVNKLKNLVGAPDTISGSFLCMYNQLTSLEGGPSFVVGNFKCNDNKIKNLVGAPSVVSGNFECSYNQLVSLEGAPIDVGGKFLCCSNLLIDLIGAPLEVGGNFDCGKNKLVNLEGAPVEVGGNFYCSNNPLKSYEGKPGKIGGKFIAPSIEQVNIINGDNVR